MSTSRPSKASLRMHGGTYAQKKVDKLFANSQFDDLSNDFPQFKFEELEIGKFLGKGGFGTVKEVRAFKIGDASLRHSRKGSMSGPDAIPDDGFETRKFIAEHCIRNGGDARYAVKYLSPEVVDDPAMYIMGITDMAVETRFLSSVEHPNIIKMRAIANGKRFCESYFIIMDRLYEILDKKLKCWGKALSRTIGMSAKVFDRDGQKAKALLIERLVAAFDLCSAIEYLHNRKIIYRDIKPQNIGFDVRGDVKLFDFGLAKEICSDTPKMSDGTFKLTGLTGSPRYMAPEVANELPYNEKCDVYSMSILIWQIMTCKVPYETYSSKAMEDKVYNGDQRPTVDESWSQPIKLLLRRAWTTDISSRATMKNLEDILKKEITSLRGGDSTGLEHYHRRSTFVYRKD